MTKAEIDVMAAGRKLDALVAEKVLGCKVVVRGSERRKSLLQIWRGRCADHYGMGEEPECMCKPDETVGVWTDGSEHCHLGPQLDDPEESQRCRVIADYSTDIASAMEVFEVVKKWSVRGTVLSLSWCDQLKLEEGEYFAEYGGRDSLELRAVGKSMQEAICKIALKAAADPETTRQR